MNGGLDSEDSALLLSALAAFISHGFHAITLAQIEAATGAAWPDLQSRYIDKEGLFLAAAEEGLIDPPSFLEGREAELRHMLERLERVNGNPRLRAIHKSPLRKLRTLADHDTAG